MGREIRRVPPDWKHPKNKRGHYKPLYGSSYSERHARWLEDKAEWEHGGALSAGHPDMSFEKWDGTAPDANDYAPEWSAEQATAYQIYETVSEGTPVSPVFMDLDSLTAWLIEQGHSESAARAFAKDGWVPSMILTASGQLYSGIDAADKLRPSAAATDAEPGGTP